MMGKKEETPGPGRPPVPPEERRSENVFTLLTPGERLKLDELSRAPQHRSRSSVLRKAFLYWLEHSEDAKV